MDSDSTTTAKASLGIRGAQVNERIGALRAGFARPIHSRSTRPDMHDIT
jgi:hypothetical protein